MLELFSAETTIVVGLDLSDEEAKLVESAVSLAKRTGSRLVLVHAIQPFRTYSNDDMILPYETFEQDLYLADYTEAEQRLHALRDRLPPELVIDINVCREHPENALESVAEDVKASLIICGMRGDKTDPWYGGMSTALSLMGSSRFPVMVLPLSTGIDFMSREHNILVADNLEDEGIYALKAAMGLCKSITHRQFIHLHVKNTSYREINQAVDKIKVAMIEGRIPSDPSFEADRYVKQMKSELKEVMHDRLESADGEFYKGLHWTPRVRFGKPREELHHTVKESHSDIIVFGKHHFLRPKGLVLGQIPYQAMIEKDVASIIVPGRDSIVAS